MAAFSQDLAFLHLWWTEVAEGRAEFTAEGVRAFGEELELAAEAAETMEANCPCCQGRGPVPAHARDAESDGSNVVHLRAAQRRGGGCHARD